MQINQKIPNSLNRQLNGYEKSLFKSESLLTFCAAFSFMVISFFITFGSDRLWDTVPFVRIVIILIGIGPSLYIMYKWGQHWLWKRRTVRDLAAGLQIHHKQLGDRLLGVIELAESDHKDENISEELREAAIRKIAEQAACIDFKKDIDRKKPSKAFLTAVLLFSSAGILFYMIPEAFNNTLIRWANPLSSISRFTFTVFSESPKNKVVPVSEPFTMVYKIDPVSLWKPSTLSYKLEGNIEGESNLKKEHTALNFAGVAQPSILHVRAGDATCSTSIKPVHRPSLKKLYAAIVYPEYIQRAPVEKKIEGGSISLLTGSTFKLKGEITRDLLFATLSSENTNAEQLSVDSKKFATEEIPVSEEKKLILNWKDIFKLSPAVPYELNLKVEEDSEPFVECPELASFSAMLVDESLKINIRAEDDYGVKIIDAEYTIDSIDGKKNKHKQTETISLSAGAPDQQKLLTSFMFSPERMNLPEKSLIVLNGVSKDFLPGRTLSRSATHRIYILSHDQHARLIQDRLERIMAEVEDLIRREKESLNKNEKISKLNNKELTTQKTTDEIMNQKRREAREKKETEKMIAEAIKLLKEALRNRKFPDKTITEWSKFLEKLQSMSQKEMQEIVSSLQKAQQQQQRREDMEKTAKTQRKMIEKMQKMLNKMDDSLKSLSVENFVHRLKKTAENENSIADSLQKMMKNIVGLDPADLPVDMKEEYQLQIEKQKSISRNAREIRDELTAFFARTRIEKYKTVVDDMDKEKMDAALSKLEKNLSANHTASSINETKKMADNLNKWADILGKKGNEQTQSRGGQGGQGGGGEVDMELLLAMLRMIQGEQNIRNKTRSLDRNKPEEKEYKEKTDRLADEQDDLHRMLESVKEKIKSCPAAVQLLESTGKAMKDAEKMLLKSQTDAETVAAETEVIERLSGAFQQSCKNAKQQQGAKMMAMLMRMLMQQQGKGGSKPGKGAEGFSDDSNKRFTGPDFQKNDPKRSIDLTGGADSIKLPEEYKSAIEAFYKKVRKGM